MRQIKFVLNARQKAEIEKTLATHEASRYKKLLALKLLDQSEGKFRNVKEVSAIADLSEQTIHKLLLLVTNAGKSNKFTLEDVLSRKAPADKQQPNASAVDTEQEKA